MRYLLSCLFIVPWLCSCSKVEKKGDHVTITMTNAIRTANVKRMGMNLTGHTQWASGQIMANMIALNPGFEGWTFGSIVEVTPGGGNQFREKEPNTGVQTDFWVGAEYEVIWGAAKGRKGRIAGFTNRQGEGGLFSCEEEGGTPVGDGDHVLLRREGDDAGGDWWIDVEGKGRYVAETSDLSPDTPGRQCLKIDAPGKDDRVSVRSYFDSYTEAGRPFLPLEGRYRLRFLAKGLVPDAAVRVNLMRLSSPHNEFLSEDVKLTGDWQWYSFEFEERRDRDPGNVELNFSVNGASVLLDDVSLVKLDRKYDTVFHDELVETLKTLNPGILRYWVGEPG